VRLRVQAALAKLEPLRHHGRRPGHGPGSGDLLIGAAEGDDAAVLRLDAERALVLTRTSSPDRGRPVRLGPGRGRHALSDVYAMGGRPLFAVNIAACQAKARPRLLGQVMRAARRWRRRPAASWRAGTRSMTVPKYGLAVVAWPTRTR